MKRIYFSSLSFVVCGFGTYFAVFEYHSTLFKLFMLIFNLALIIYELKMFSFERLMSIAGLTNAFLYLGFTFLLIHINLEESYLKDVNFLGRLLLKSLVLIGVAFMLVPPIHSK